MIRCAFVLFALTPLAVAAPVPKESETEKIKKLYGEIVDPDKDCKFKLDGEKLLITMPGGKRYEYWDLDEKPPWNQANDWKALTNCPRVLREIEGDFVVTVRAYASLPKEPKPAEGTLAEAGAGIIVVNDKGRVWRAGTHDFLSGKGQRDLMAIIPGSHGPSGFELTPGSEGVGLDMRFVRQGDRIRLEHTNDGKKWFGGFSTAVDKEGKLKVGVYGFSNSKSDTTVTFEKFEVKPVEKK
jgi:regulation of enolase protein 1 (concanavalin A-like superfamily)